MPTLTVTWTRTDVNNSWPGERGIDSNAVVTEGAQAAAAQARANFQITQDTSDSADGLVRTVTYTGQSADLQDYFQSLQPYFMPEIDQTDTLYGITLDVQIEPDLADTFPQYPTS